jgi:hypothetical protein
MDDGFGLDLVMLAAWAIFNSESDDTFTERWLPDLTDGVAQ